MAPQRRHPSGRPLLAGIAAAAALLAMPGGASAAAPNPLAGATLTSVTSTLTIKTSRCPPGAEQSDKSCGHADLVTSFSSGPKPATRTIAGSGTFPAGIRAAGTGQSRCTSESPSAESIAAADGSYALDSALHVSSAGVTATDLLVATGKRGARWAWTEPIRPSTPCDYFYGAGDVAVPADVALPSFVTSPWLPTSRLRRRTFGVTLEVSRQFQTAASDGTIVYGDASWRLRLSYKRYAALR